MLLGFYIKIFLRNFNFPDIPFIVISISYPLIFILSIDIAQLPSYSLIAAIMMGIMPFMYVIKRGIFMDISQRIVQADSTFHKFISICKADAISLSIMPIGLLFAYYVTGHTSPIFALNIVLTHAIASMIFTDIKMLATRSAKCSVSAKLCGGFSSFAFIPIAYKCGHPEQRIFLDTFEAFYQQHEAVVCVVLAVACMLVAYGASRHVRSYLSSSPFPSPTVMQKYNKNYLY